MALQFVLLPLLAQTFSLSYAQVGMLRAVSHSAMSLLELPAGLFAERVGERRLLVIGLLGAGLGYLCVAFASSFNLIAVGFFIAGAGAALQHSLASSVLVKRFDAGARRRALGTYNSAGDAGKLSFTAAFSALVGAGLSWNWVITGLACVTLGFAVALSWLLRPSGAARAPDTPAGTSPSVQPKGWGITNVNRFSALALMVFLDSVVQAVFLTFIAFIMQAKGASQGTAGAAVVLALAGGMVGKFACGFLAAHLGDRATFIVVQLLTVVGLGLLTMLSAEDSLVFLPLLGLVVQGSTTVSYGAVAEFVAPGYQARGYALIYSTSSVSSVVGPFLLGWVADVSSLDTVLWILAALSAATVSFSAVLPGRAAAKPQSSQSKEA
jgi:MFS transporter, FSR family, fosmidomycin resistance protein